MMATTYRMVGATEVGHAGLKPQTSSPQTTDRSATHTCEPCLGQELSSVYYTLFRGLFLACFFFSCYGVDLYVWKR